MTSSNYQPRLTSAEGRILIERVTKYLITRDKKDSYACDSLELPHLSVHDTEYTIEVKRRYRTIFQTHLRRIESTFGPDVMFRSARKFTDKLQEWIDRCWEIEQEHQRNSKVMQILEPHYRSLETYLIDHFEKVLEIFVAGIIVDRGEGEIVEELRTYYNDKIGRSLDPLLKEVRQFFKCGHSERSLMAASFGTIVTRPATNSPPKWCDASNDTNDIKGMKSLWIPLIDALEQRIKHFMGKDYSALPISFDHMMDYCWVFSS